MIRLKLKEIRRILDADVLSGDLFLDKEVCSAFGSDLMSDVLAFVNDGTLLLTGLTNPQVIRTAEVIDLFAIVFVRGKKPSKEMLEMAKEMNMTVMVTDHVLYTACGKLYNEGLKGVDIQGVYE